jgi:hypothetical protein
MLALTIEDKSIENIFLKEFHSDKVNFFNFIKSSFDKLKQNDTFKTNASFEDLQINSMSKTWENDKDKVWDEL